MMILKYILRDKRRKCWKTGDDNNDMDDDDEIGDFDKWWWLRWIGTDDKYDDVNDSYHDAVDDGNDKMKKKIMMTWW